MSSQIQQYNQVYRSFRVTKYLPLQELQSTLIELVHEPTGAKVMHIANEDPENLFCLSFQTIPKDSTGVAHILEHTVLCGSKKFPVKDPFFSMTRRSLNTYMNALTGQDFTCYPASSQVEKDFYNLLEVYLDAVFFPELKQMSFLQEGHRLSLSDPNDVNSPLKFEGVVYNEMKGALSSPDARLWESLLHYLTPNLTYAFNSGGDPKEIPNLSYEDLKKFHETFYHPSRCLFFFYGNLALEKHLDFILENVLDKSIKKEPLSPLPKQTRFSQALSVKTYYPISKENTEEKTTWLVYSWLTCSLIDQETVLALCVLDNMLMETDASILKKALLKSGLCNTIDSSLDCEMSEIPFTIVCKECDAKDVQEIKKVIFSVFENFRPSQEMIESALHQLEFERSEIGAEGIPFGLTLFFRAALTKQHGVDPESALLIHSLFNQLREKAKNPDYFPNLIKKFFIENQHFVTLTFLADPNLLQKEDAEEKEKLSQLSTTVDKKELLLQAKRLFEYHESIETQSLDCLPKIHLSDIPSKPRDYSLQETKNGNLTIFHHECFTNHILYADLVYDLPPVAFEDLGLISLYSQFLTEVGCANRNYEENLAYQQAYTGGIDTSLAIHIDQKQPSLLQPSFMIRGKALLQYQDKLLFLFKDLCHGVDFDDIDRLKELLIQQATYLRNRLSRKALSYAIQIALSETSESAAISNQLNGLPFYHFVLKWVKDPKGLSKELKRIQEILFKSSYPQLVVSCDQKQFLTLKEHDFYNLSSSLPYGKKEPWNLEARQGNIHSQVRFIPSPVAFTAKGLYTIHSSDPDSPYLLLASELLKNCYLHKEIREKGGAYGGGASYSPSSGGFYFYAYRDPQLVNTMEAFKRSVEKISQQDFSEEDLLEAKFKVIQILDTPVAPGNRAMTAYLWKRSNQSYEERKRYRDQILNASRSAIANSVKKYLLSSTSIVVSFLGEELYKQEKEKLIDPLEVLPI